eukprot:scaffold206957_cov17-Tisochrysis_lutea.AAC.1
MFHKYPYLSLQNSPRAAFKLMPRRTAVHALAFFPLLCHWERPALDVHSQLHDATPRGEDDCDECVKGFDTACWVALILSAVLKKLLRFQASFSGRTA